MARTRTARSRAKPAEWQVSFVERFSLLAEAQMPRSTARVLAWLIVSDPAHQSAEQLRTTLQLSAGSVSAAVSLLVRGGFVERVTFPGNRRIHYRLAPGGWQRVIRERAKSLTAARVVAEGALRESGPHQRLEELRDVYAWWESRFADLVDAYANSMRNAPARSRSRSA